MTLYLTSPTEQISICWDAHLFLGPLVITQNHFRTNTVTVFDAVRSQVAVINYYLTAQFSAPHSTVSLFTNKVCMSTNR